jgi:hypothetical protein
MLKSPRHEEMIMNSLESKLVEWFRHPAVRAHDWDPAMFWKPRDAHDPFGVLRVDPAELEVYFAALLDYPSDCLAEVNARHDWDHMLALPRGDFLALTAHRHEVPLFSPRLH